MVVIRVINIKAKTGLESNITELHLITEKCCSNNGLDDEGIAERICIPWKSIIIRRDIINMSFKACIKTMRAKLVVILSF